MLLAYLYFTHHPPHRTALTILVVLLCALPPEWWVPKRLREAVQRITRRRWIAVALVGVISFIATSTLASKRGMPLPYVHDEFSYLLAADTFARGRLTNPSPPMWEHFETMHVLVTPTYQSKYPPGQGLMLALGQVLIGHPIWALWITTALACMAITWTLLAIAPTRWALIGGLLTALHPQVLEWGQRYWGGSLAMLGGALFIGAMLRITDARHARPWLHGILAGIGLAILANTRPFEGAILAILIGLWFCWRWWKQRLSSPVAAMLGIAVVLIPAAMWMGYYNWRVTGDPLRLPYQEHQRQYGYVPLFLFQELPDKPTYNHPELGQFHIHDQRVAHDRRQSWRQLMRGTLDNLYGLGLSVFGNVGVLAIPLVLWPWALWNDRRVRTFSLILILFLTALMTATFISGHYAAPVAPIVAAILILLMRRLYVAWGWVGRFLVRLTVTLTLLWSGFWWTNFFNWKQEGFPVQRQRILDHLQSQPGQHLALVRYGPGHDVHQEWVYNEADLEAAKVVWARSMDAYSNRRLTEHFSERRIWILDVSQDGARLSQRN